MKKILIFALALTMIIGAILTFTGCSYGIDFDYSYGTITVYTNAYYPPLEYYSGTEIVGVEVEIMNLVGKNMNKNVKFVNKDFAYIIDYVSDDKLCDCAAAGFIINEERSKKVSFSVPYYTSVQYVIFPKASGVTVNTAKGDEKLCYYWEQIAGKTVGVQLDTFGNIYVDGEVNGWDADNSSGVICGTNTTVVPFDDAQLTYTALKAGRVDCVVMDMLVAQYLIKNDTADYVAYPLYYYGGAYENDYATSEEYAIAVNKNNTELLKEINAVLNELLADVNDGKNGVDRLVMKHYGISVD